MSSNTSGQPSGTKTYHVILTGSTGFLGQHLLKSFVTNGIHPLSSRQGVTHSSCDVNHYHIYALCRSSSNGKELENLLKQDLERNISEKQKINVTVDVCMNFDITNQETINQWINEHCKDIAIDICIHTAAISSPRLCQENIEHANSMNVPKYFFDALYQNNPNLTMIALSTDQVYDGINPPYAEEDSNNNILTPNPINVYGQTKLDMERTLLNYSSSLSGDAAPSSASIVVLLRSSIILGPKAPYIQAHDTFLHFCKSRIGQSTTYYTDERRNVIFVENVIQTIVFFMTITTTSSDTNVGGIYNMGGPQSVSRYDMAVAVVDYFTPKSTTGSTSDMDSKEDYRKFVLSSEKNNEGSSFPPSPLDITMDCTKLYNTLKAYGVNNNINEQNDDSDANSTINSVGFRTLDQMIQLTFEEPS